MTDPSAQPESYSVRKDRSGLLIGGTVCIVIVVPILIHFGKMLFGVAQ